MKVEMLSFLAQYQRRPFHISRGQGWHFNLRYGEASRGFVASVVKFNPNPHGHHLECALRWPLARDWHVDVWHLLMKILPASIAGVSLNDVRCMVYNDRYNQSPDLGRPVMMSTALSRLHVLLCHLVGI